MKMDDGTLIQLNIGDPVRFGQEVQAGFTSGKNFFAAKHLIILPQITEAAIRTVVDQLIGRGFFEPVVQR
ncbi:MAG TPA: hypothetical protein VF018_06635 [Acidobacteriaceae bacterium]